jgi:hypothetical protein
MYRSAPRYAVRTADRVEAPMIQVALRPAQVANTGRHPQFILDCTSWWTEGRTKFEQTCRQLTELTTADGRVIPAPRYAINEFTFHLWVSENDPFCPAGQTRLSFTATIDMNTTHVNEIKQAVADQYIEPIRTAILRLFNERAFFTAYYENFYEKWLDSLR